MMAVKGSPNKKDEKDKGKTVRTYAGKFEVVGDKHRNDSGTTEIVNADEES